ncbi:MAG: hypothetical protein DLM68_16075 [Hyphomicrobiales bacterium]|nr:MAG: hypothetical protein DLM68_16075 [Hyphomicrobiales bacterium]
MGLRECSWQALREGLAPRRSHSLVGTPAAGRDVQRDSNGIWLVIRRRNGGSGQLIHLKAFLWSVGALEFEAFKGSENEAALDNRLRRWSARKDLGERSAESAFIQEFFRDTWGYEQTGQAGAQAGSFTLWPQFPIARAGEKGGVGVADLAIGFFEKDDKNPVPQVCANSRTFDPTSMPFRSGKATIVRRSVSVSTT